MAQGPSKSSRSEAQDVDQGPRQSRQQRQQTQRITDSTDEKSPPQSVEKTSDVFGKRSKLPDQSLFDQRQPSAQLQERLDFCIRAESDRDMSTVCTAGTPAEALGHVRGNGVGCSANLRPNRKEIFTRKRSCGAVNSLGQIHPLLPNDQLLKTCVLRHCRSSQFLQHAPTHRVRIPWAMGP
jgi:hypothetical protein